MKVRTATELGALIRERRRALRLDQQSLADKVGVSRQWIVDVEKGKPTVELGLVLRTFEAMSLTINIAEAPGPGRGKRAVVDIDAIVDRARGRR